VVSLDLSCNGAASTVACSLNCKYCNDLTTDSR
jgi:hypothetical protein